MTDKLVTICWSLTPHSAHIAHLGGCSLHTYTAGHRENGKPCNRWVVYRDGKLCASGTAADESDARQKAVTVGALYTGVTT